MPGSPTTPGWPSARVGALGHIAFHYTDSVSTRNDVGRYSFIAVYLHHLLRAGLPAHLCENTGIQFARRKSFSISSV